VSAAPRRGAFWASDLPALVVALAILVLDGGLTGGAAAWLAWRWPHWARQAAASTAPAAPAAHPPGPPQDPARSRAESCERLRGLLQSLDGQLERSQVGAPLPQPEVERLVAEGPCTLDSPGVQGALERYRRAFERAGLDPPPILPQVER
jgi:hypothetical protein